jgi:DMSO/TMAO reductase YedYZ molybdopterin-dependent catalytic subunit
MLMMPATNVEATLYCYPNKLIPVQEGNWTGIRLSLLLQMAGLREDVVELVFYASDGFTADISVEDALRSDVIIAYKLNGKPIGGRKGYPKNRLVIPGAWGFKWIAWIVRIEAVDYDFEASYGEMEEPVDIPLGSTVSNRYAVDAFPLFVRPGFGVITSIC